nr:DUF4097 family beta strand repeat-containing protein [Paenibacillus shirakamiensis]
MLVQQSGHTQNSNTYTKKWTFDPGQLHDLVVKSDYSVDVAWIKSTDGTNYVEASGRMAEKTIDQLKQADVHQGTLDLNLKDASSIQFLSVNFRSDTQRIVIALSNLQNIEKVRFDLAAANGTFRDMQANNIEISSESGSIMLNAIASNHLKVNVESGNITGEAIASNFDWKAESGDIKINRLSGNGSAATESGNIRITDQNASQLELSAESGNIYVTPNPNFQGIYDAKADSGSVQVPNSPQITQDVIKARTDSGDISIRANN